MSPPRADDRASAAAAYLRQGVRGAPHAAWGLGLERKPGGGEQRLREAGRPVGPLACSGFWKVRWVLRSESATMPISVETCESPMVVPRVRDGLRERSRQVCPSGRSLSDPLEYYLACIISSIIMLKTIALTSAISDFQLY